MKVFANVPWTTAALAVALLAANAMAAGPKDKDAKSKKAPAKTETPVKIDKNVEAWVKTLTDKIADRYDTIRESARHALVAMGKAALPSLHKVAEGADGASAEAAKHVIAAIEGGHKGQSGQDRASWSRRAPRPGRASWSRRAPRP